MTAAAVAAARERELPVVGLQTTPEGLPLYLSMGFRQITATSSQNQATATPMHIVLRMFFRTL